ncbi:Wzz/FepE/Etk N-terminal domain-containing protein [Parapedobacter sp. DT-150]|uniref:Wzz/FepE/Etk N-terminal domain-containing protein n=1 Tax=Parapedobacter sp. DT-150 TaxID=3396162 RepID=UPI003F1AEC57
MDIKKLLSFLWQYKWLIIMVPLASLAITYFLVKDLPKQYVSRAMIGAESGVSEQLLSANPERHHVWQQLYRIAEMMRMKRELDALSYRLIIYDLEHPEKPFRPYSQLLNDLSHEKKETVLQAFKSKLTNQSLLTVKDNEALGLMDLVTSMKYDDKNLSKQLDINVKEELDYIYAEFGSENPDLSAYVVNTLASDFIYRYNSASSSESKKSLALLDSIIRNKERIMNQKNAQLASYRSYTGASSKGGQSDVLYQQILAYENRESEVRREIASLRGAIASINSKLENPNDRDLNSPSSAGNNELINLENQLQLANQRYIDNGFNAEDKRAVDSLQRLRSAKVASSSTRNTGNSQANRQSLVAERMRLETQLALAENSVSSIQTEISTRRAQYNAMIPADVGAQSLLRDADLATKEYTEALDRYNQASIANNTSGMILTLVESGIPGQGEDSKQRIYLALSAVASSALCFSALFFIFLLDKKVRTPRQLTELTRGKVVSTVNYIGEDDKDLRNIWADDGGVVDYSVYKDCIRSLRFELSAALAEDQGKVLGITSLHFGEGKTFVSSSLAYAFALTGQKVLLICEHAPDLLTLITNKKIPNEQNFETFLTLKEIRTEDRITVLSKNTSRGSLLEIKDTKSLIAGFDILRSQFDIIIIDIDCLQDFNKVKEWLMFTDKNIAVFKADSTVRDEDQEYIEYLRKQPGFLGWVFNMVRVA